MFEYVEKCIPYIYYVISVFFISVFWTVIKNKMLVLFIIRKPKSYRKLKGRGVEVCEINGNVEAKYVDGDAHVTFSYGKKMEIIDTVSSYGKYERGENEARLMYVDGKLSVICFDLEIMTSALLKLFSREFRYTFITAIGVSALWNMLLKM